MVCSIYIIELELSEFNYIENTFIAVCVLEFCESSDTYYQVFLFRCNEMIAATQSLTIQETSMKIQAMQAKEVGAA